MATTKFSAIAISGFAAFAIAHTVPKLEAGQALFLASFDSEGIAVKTLSIDPETGKIGKLETVLRDAGTPLMWSMAVSDDGRRLATVNIEEENPEFRGVYLLGASKTPVEIRKALLPNKPEGAVFWGDKLVAYTSRGAIFLIDHESGRIERSVEVRNLTTPKTNVIQSIAVVPGENLVVCVMRDDVPGGKRFGSRLIGLNLPDFAVKFDVRLGRDEIARLAGDRQDVTAEILDGFGFGSQSRMQGAGPNGIAFSRRTNTAAITLDNYGMVILCDLDALCQGALKNATLHFPPGALGHWFPAPPIRLEASGRDQFVVAGAGAPKVAILDAEKRQLAQVLEMPAPATLSWPVALPEAGMAVFARAGINRERGIAGIDESHREQNDLVFLKFGAGADAAPQLTLQTFPDHLYLAARACPETGRYLLLAFMEPESRQMKLSTYDVEKRVIVDTLITPDVLRGAVFGEPGN